MAKKKNEHSHSSRHQHTHKHEKNYEQEEKEEINVIEIPSSQTQILGVISRENPENFKVYEIFKSKEGFESSIYDYQIPKSLEILNKFAESEGYESMGQISNYQSNKYIGRSKIESGNQLLVEPYPRVEIKNGETPDLMTNFRFYAGKAINSWNQFVKDEENFVNYASKVSNPQKAKQEFLNKVKHLTRGTFQAQFLATLVYFYIRLPLEKIFRTQFQDYTNSRDSFFQHYSLEIRPRENPFFLSIRDGLGLCNLLLEHQSIQRVYDNCCAFIETANAEGAFQKQKEAKMKALNYVQEKINETITCYENMGLEFAKVSELIESPTAYDIKTMRNLFPAIKKNVEIDNIFQKVINERRGVALQDRSMNDWEIEIDMEMMPCYNYIF